MSRRSLGPLVLGGFLVFVGVVLLLDRLDVVSSGRVWGMVWPLLLVALGLAALAVTPRAWLGPVLITALGAFLLLGTAGLVKQSAWDFAWPIAVIIIGLSILAASTAGHADSDRVTAIAFWWGAERRSVSQQFRGAGLTAIMGGVELDLRQAGLAPGAQVDAFALMGGISVKVPPGWRVEMTGLPLLGGYENKTVLPADPTAPVLTVHAVAIMGGVDVRYGKGVHVPPPAWGTAPAAPQPPYPMQAYGTQPTYPPPPAAPVPGQETVPGPTA